MPLSILASAQVLGDRRGRGRRAQASGPGAGAGRSAIAQRTQNIINMVIQKDTNEKVVDPGDPDYFVNIYTRPYFMTSSVFDKFCDTQISNNSHYLPDLIKFESLNVTFVTKKSANTELDYITNSIDLTCKEVMPIEESPESTNFDSNNKMNKLTNYSIQDTTICDYDSDDSVRDKDYNPSECGATSSDDSVSEIKQKKLRKTQKNNNTNLATENSPPTYKTFSGIANRKILHKLRRSSFDIMRIVPPKKVASSQRRNTIDVGVFQLLTTDDTSHSLEQEPSSQKKLSQEDRELINRSYWKMNFVDQHFRNNYDVMYKNDFDDEYTQLRFMNDKYIKNPKVFKLEFRTNPKGIDVERKAGILQKLTNIIPPHKLVFWNNLPTTPVNVEASTSGARNYKK
ncbi:hypothetical protein SFRURICE_015396 [Spodoptera frugiperda]|nr:hypothetical protein SFRURICE_015396 [Spodoptera frugiperda]